jgi:transcriptional regulator with XRE-family HTH domain
MNNEDIIRRLEEILKHYELSASVFADKINVQRSSLSHLLHGRNKPSLDFILKIDSAFPEVDLYWLLYGKGVFPAKVDKSDPQSFSAATHGDTLNKQIPNNSEKSVERIVIFYKDGTFKSFKEQ